MLKFGIKTSQGGYSYNELSEVWKKTEELGFDSAFLYDHLSAVGNPKDNCLEAYSTLGALARDTSKLRIGVMATSVNYRNPGLLAKITS
ncbi:MAG: LLM class flavin-dependent oxidoreductase, partial [Thaumarchaeota archaeon]|nr:LLM class flavin-dependent oxidoreductase [Nitrososphaerota archaeon]